MIQTYLEALKSALQSLKANKLRSFLTTLGVVIGTFAVIGLVSIVSGLKAEIKEQIIGLGADILDIVPSSREGQQQSLGTSGLLASFSREDFEAIRREATLIDLLTETYQSVTNFSWGKNDENAFLIGCRPDYFPIINKKAGVGRLLEATDLEKQAKVIVIGDSLAKELFGAALPTGKTIKVDNEPFEVVGVLEKLTKTGGFDPNRAAYIPSTTARRVFPETKINEIFAKAQSPELADEAAHEVERILKVARRDKGFSVLTQKDIMDIIDNITRMISLALAGVASISLLVGGIGIMNIMLVSVTERTKEIGLRKALGAEDQDILIQFLIEAVILCLLGGLIGVAIAETGSLLVSKFTELPSLIDLPTILAALGFSVTVGLVFGTAPAIKAARLDPIEALRHD